MAGLFQKTALAALSLFSGWLPGQALATETGIVTLRITVPDTTPIDARLHLGAAFNNWDPKQGDYGITRGEDGVWVGRLPPFQVGKLILFKVTRGAWDNVEVDAMGQPIPDRRYKVLPGEQVLEITVAGWEDLLEKGTAESTAVVDIIRETFQLPTYDGDRAVYIYLPSDYDRSGRRYPVIYMSDGRNLFDQTIGAPREWGMDELMERWQEEGSDLTSIVVGVDHADANRTSEYAPWDYGFRPFGGGKGKGAQWADWVVETLKPSIDSRYRTLPRPRRHDHHGQQHGWTDCVLYGTAPPGHVCQSRLLLARLRQAHRGQALAQLHPRNRSPATDADSHGHGRW